MKPTTRKHPSEYTNEELGIDPEADAKKFFYIILALVILLGLGFILLISVFLYEFTNRRDPIPTEGTAIATAISLPQSPTLWPVSDRATPPTTPRGLQSPPNVIRPAS
jgi:hypothetical protein